MKEQILEQINKLKSIFSEETQEVETTEVAETTEETSEEVNEVEAVAFAEVTLMDGETVLSYEGELAPGTSIFVIAEGEQIPAPEGAHALGGEMEGVTIVVDADGVISEVIDEREAGDAEVAEEEMSAEELINAKMSEVIEPLTKVLEGFESLLNENKELKSKIEELEQSFSEFKETPTEDEESAKFSRQGKLTQRQKFLLNKRKK